MHNLIHLASSGFEGLFWVVVVIIAIIAQIVKSRKQFDQGAPRQDQPPSEGDAAEELRKFLEGLGQAQKPPPPSTRQLTPAPAPPPVPRQVTRPAAPASRPPPVHAQRFPPRERREPRPPPVTFRETAVRTHAPEPVHAPTEAEVMARFRAEMAAKAAAAKPILLWQRALVAQLTKGDRQLLQEAIVLREVFGPPVALRRRDIPYPLV